VARDASALGRPPALVLALTSTEFWAGVDKVGDFINKLGAPAVRLVLINPGNLSTPPDQRLDVSCERIRGPAETDSARGWTSLLVLLEW
jgi:hypothetical protein